MTRVISCRGWLVSSSPRGILGAGFPTLVGGEGRAWHVDWLQSNHLQGKPVSRSGLIN